MKIETRFEKWDNHSIINMFLINKDSICGRVALELGDDYVSIYGLNVDPELRGQKHGARLLANCILTFERDLKQYDTLFIKVNKSYDRLIKWYEGFGFEYYPCTNECETYLWMSLKRNDDGKPIK
jgi:ribosomal protein S18 acetylase RimI-like enzyme